MLVLRKNEAYHETHLFILPRFNCSFEIDGPKPAVLEILDGKCRDFLDCDGSKEIRNPEKWTCRNDI